MEINHPSHLNLLFPQWQGSGPSNLLFYGAHRLAHTCPINFVPVPVPEKDRLQVAHDILGYEAIVSQLARAKTIIEQANPESIMVIGGDCGVELSPVSFINQIHSGNLALVWLDAHAMTQVSIREMAADPKSILRAIQKKGLDHVYIHIDMDVLDPEHYPHVKHPTPHGLMPETLEKILAQIASSFQVAGLGIVEFTTDHMNHCSKPPPVKTGSLTQIEPNPDLAWIKSLIDIFR